VILDGILDRIVAEAEALHRICPWCCVTLGDDGPYCSPYCGEEYERRLMPRAGVERVGIVRPAPAESVKALHRAGQATLAKQRWLAAHPHEAP
jgi:hypothetical protein